MKWMNRDSKLFYEQKNGYDTYRHSMQRIAVWRITAGGYMSLSERLPHRARGGEERNCVGRGARALSSMSSAWS